jgi:hypothetical protein
MAKFEFKGKEFDLNLVAEGNKLQRVVVVDGGLDFPFENYEKAADFLASEYGGNVDEVLAILNATESLEGYENAGASKVDPKKMEKKSGKKGTGKAKTEKKEKEEKEPKAPKAEKQKMTFKLPKEEVTRDVQIKTILPDQVPIKMEDVKLTEKVGLHIDIYSAKNRTAEIYSFKEGVAVTTVLGKSGGDNEVDCITNYADVKGEVLLGNVSLMDVIYKFAEVEGMSFQQADKYIKISRGLLAKVEKKPKEEKVTADTLKGKKGKKEENAETPAESEVKAEVVENTEA